MAIQKCLHFLLLIKNSVTTVIIGIKKFFINYC
jgi:hypothetical protein